MLKPLFLIVALVATVVELKSPAAVANNTGLFKSLGSFLFNRRPVQEADPTRSIQASSTASPIHVAAGHESAHPYRPRPHVPLRKKLARRAARQTYDRDYGGLGPVDARTEDYPAQEAIDYDPSIGNNRAPIGYNQPYPIANVKSLGVPDDDDDADQYPPNMFSPDVSNRDQYFDQRGGSFQPYPYQPLQNFDDGEEPANVNEEGPYLGRVSPIEYGRIAQYSGGELSKPYEEDPYLGRVSPIEYGRIAQYSGGYGNRDGLFQEDPNYVPEVTEDLSAYIPDEDYTPEDANDDDYKKAAKRNKRASKVKNLKFKKAHPKRLRPKKQGKKQH